MIKTVSSAMMLCSGAMAEGQKRETPTGVSQQARSGTLRI